MLIVDGYDEAVIGRTTRGLFVYDVSKIISIMMEKDEMSEEDAIDYFYYNIDGAYMGEETPIFMYCEEFDVQEHI